ncbi:MAG TPA: hypothetical protein VHB77_05985, partial [Planctomycetaceae bacterium]|nr:hypothetical protein [Planctomycetaceae bacterium]
MEFGFLATESTEDTEKRTRTTSNVDSPHLGLSSIAESLSVASVISVAKTLPFETCAWTWLGLDAVHCPSDVTIFSP